MFVIESRLGCFARPLGPPLTSAEVQPKSDPNRGFGSSAWTFSLVVPLYNEAERLADYASPLLDFLDGLPVGSDLIFVDDGSTDGTAAAVAAIAGDREGRHVRLVRCPHAGKGSAISSGIDAARGEYVGFCDVDLRHRSTTSSSSSS